MLLWHNKCVWGETFSSNSALDTGRIFILFSSHINPVHQVRTGARSSSSSSTVCQRSHFVKSSSKLEHHLVNGFRSCAQLCLSCLSTTAESQENSGWNPRESTLGRLGHGIFTGSRLCRFSSNPRLDRDAHALYLLVHFVCADRVVIKSIE